MPFDPLPTSFIERLATLDPATDTVLELGSGDGGLSALIAARAGRCLCLDRRRPAVGVACDLVGDARFPPLRAGSLAVVVAGNLARHLSPQNRLGQWVGAWRRLLQPGGTLFLLEDDPDPAIPAQRNFRDLQRFLGRLLPESRGPLLPLSRFRDLVAADAAAREWTSGHQTNRAAVDAEAVLRLLRGGQGRLTGAEAALSRAITRDGIAPGRYWWAAAGPSPQEAV